MSLLSAFNFMELSNVKHANRAQMKLDDYKDEAQALQQQGMPVASWHEFNASVEQKKPNYMRNITVGLGAGAAAFAALGAAIGTAGAALVPMALTGGALGGMLGGYRETENSQRNAKVEAYGQYLKQASAAVSGGITPEQLASLVVSESQSAQKDEPSPMVAPEIIAANAAPEVEMEHGCGCGH